MSYLDVLPLARVLNYLRVDEDLEEDDNEIQSMIKAACIFVEKRTNHIFYAREITYRSNILPLKVYDYPINEIVAPTDPVVLHFSLHDVFPNETEVTLNVGYEDPTDVPEELKQACLQMIKVWYYESEKQVNSTLIPESVMQVIDTNRRFL
jgi:hypothetical protein